MHVPDGVGPPELSVIGVDANGEGVVEMGNCGNVPGVTGQGACAETAHIMDQIRDDCSDDLEGKPGGRGRGRRRGLQGNTP